MTDLCHPRKNTVQPASPTVSSTAMAQSARKASFPWLPFVLTLIAIFIFWALPAILGERSLELTESPTVVAPSPEQ